MYALLMRVLLRRIDAEVAHRVGMALLRVGLRPAPVRAVAERVCAPDPRLATTVLGLRLPSPLGVAAGLDKNARTVVPLAALGFGFVEIGTVTARPQPGNPRPRLVRLVEDRAIVNRMGFNNDGAAVIASRLAALRRTPAGRRVVIGVNVGRSKAAAPEETVADYCTSARLLAPHADYLTINISSPNTPGLRDLHDPVLLRPLLVALRSTCDAARPGRRLPVLLKISPDSSDADVAAVAALAAELGLDGLIATNTTVARRGLASPPAEVSAAGTGGLSGVPLRARAGEVLRRLAGGGGVLVASGGIDSPADVAARLGDGAELVQAYTGFVYGGALWPRRVNRFLSARTAGR